jgi:hypothetical protein
LSPPSHKNQSINSKNIIEQNPNSCNLHTHWKSHFPKIISYFILIKSLHTSMENENQ